MYRHPTSEQNHATIKRVMTIFRNNMRQHRTLFIFLLVVLLASCSKTLPKVDQALLDAAEQGDATAQMKVALACDEAGDPEEAARWYALAAEQGVSEAQNNLGVMYKEGQGVSLDYAEAARWFMKAAEQDNTLSQLNLGWLYHAGKGVRQDADSARYWYMQAAEKGHPTAWLNLGVLSLQQGDTVQAEIQLLEAESMGNEGARRLLEGIDRAREQKR